MRQLQEHPRFKDVLGEAHRSLIAKAAPLHDIGKVGVPDHILLKPGKLTPEEFEIMKTHSQIGADAIDDAIHRVLGEDSDMLKADRDDSPLAFLEVARQIAIGHHERWDGGGYPKGLAGEAIPVPARLMALSDVFDALTCRRHYKEAFPMERTLEIICEGRGRHFDPDVVDAFLEIRDSFADIARRYADAPA
jgi:putative two-component system response regulator